MMLILNEQIKHAEEINYFMACKFNVMQKKHNEPLLKGSS